MRKTYSYSGIIIGFLIGMLAWAKTENIAIGIVVGLVVAVAAFVAIRLLENALYKGADKLTDKAQEVYRNHKDQKAMQNGTYNQPNVTQMPQQNATQFPQRNAAAAAPQRICPNCGQPVKADAAFCAFCGSKLEQ